MPPVRGRSRNRDAGRRFTPQIETLEDRWLLSACTVTSLADSGPGTLRDCIDQVNAGSADAINFAAVGVVHVHSNLPAVINPVTIAGPQSVPPTICIEPDDTGFATIGLQILGGNSTAANLCIGGFTGFGSVGLVLGSNPGDTVLNTYLGFGGDTGFGPLPNNQGLLIGSGAGNSVIGGTMAGQGNVIANNFSIGLEIQSGATHNRLIGNYIGTDPNDALNEGNGAGLIVESDSNTIGGASAEERNVISGNQAAGVQLTGASNNLIQGNYIGTNVMGLDYLKDPYHPLVNGGNGGNGINVYFSAHDNTIGGTDPVLHNLITGNPLDGILIDAEAFNNRA